MNKLNKFSLAVILAGCFSMHNVQSAEAFNENLLPTPGISRPITQTSSLVFSSVQNTGMIIGWTKGSGSFRAVFVKEGSGAITNPSDLATYTASANWASKGTQLGTSGYYCVYNGAGSSVSLTALTTGTQYTVQVFEYNGPASYEMYLTTTASDNPKSQSTVCSIEVANINDSGAGSLRQAINDLCDNGTITFNSSLSGLTISLSGELVVNKGITIDGTALASTITVSGSSLSRVFNIDATGKLVTFKKLIVGSGANGTGDGGGIYLAAGDMVLNGVTISGCNAVSGGAFYQLSSGTVSFTDVTISTNYALWGAGIYMQEGTQTHLRSLISGNSATGTGAAAGGFYQRNGTSTFTDSEIKNNTAVTFGGGFYTENAIASLTLSNTTVSGNTVSDGAGGGLYINKGTIALNTTCKITGNHAQYVSQFGNGGGIYLLTGSLTSTSSTIKENTSANSGGGLYIHNSDATYTSTDDVISTNTAGLYGAGVAVYNGNAGFLRATISGNISSNRGGGIYLWAPASTITITSSTLSANETKYDYVRKGESLLDITYGGAIFMDNAHVDITSSTFTGNTATRTDTNGPKGGAIYLFQGTLDISGTGFSTNSTNTEQGKGGAIFNDLGTLTIGSNCTFTSNTAGRSGGAIFTNQSTAVTTYNNCTFTSNTAGKLGGALYLQDGIMTGDNCIFDSNSATVISGAGGGAIDHNLGISTTKNSTFKNNSSVTGGAFYFKSGIATIINSLFYDNSATAYGGGIFTELSTADLRLVNSTLAGNSATTGGGGIANQASIAILINNSVLWNNTTPGTGNQIGNSHATPFVINNSCYKNETNDVSGNITPTNCINSDPLFVDATGKNFGLKGDSPCADAGNSAYCSETLDIRGDGYGRKLNKADGTAGTIDIGAYEYKYVCTNPTSGGTIAADQTGATPFDPALITSSASPTGHTGTLEVKWQKSTTSSTDGFADIASSTDLTYNPGSITQDTWYKRISRVSCKSDWTGATASNVLKMTIDLTLGDELLQAKSGLVLQNYPNPFKSATTIHYRLPFEGRLTITISTLGGTAVKVIIDAEQPEGDYNFILADDLPEPGVYLATMKLNGNGNELIKTIKLVKVR